MSGHAQIDFKAIDLGTCQIDHVKMWEGSEPDSFSGIALKSGVTPSVAIPRR